MSAALGPAFSPSHSSQFILFLKLKQRSPPCSPSPLKKLIIHSFSRMMLLTRKPIPTHLRRLRGIDHVLAAVGAFVCSLLPHQTLQMSVIHQRWRYSHENTHMSFSRFACVVLLMLFCRRNMNYSLVVSNLNSGVNWSFACGWSDKLDSCVCLFY